MKPPPFTYLAPQTKEEVVDLLTEQGDDAKLLAGGQSLVPLLNFRLSRPGILVDLNTVAGMAGIDWDAETGELVFGAMVRQIDAERSPLVQSHCPLLAEALKHIGHRAIRNRGTIGGSLAHADPAAELPLILTALNGRVKLASARGERWVRSADFFLTYLTTAIEADEVLVEARFPGCPSDRKRWAFEEFSRRHGDFAIAAAAVTLHLDEAGRVDETSIAIAGGGPTPFRAGTAEQVLLGQRPTEKHLAEAGALAAAAADPEPDLHASAEYRRTLIGSLVQRTLARAARPPSGLSEAGLVDGGFWPQPAAEQ